MTILIRGKKITIEKELVELAKKYFIDLDEEYCTYVLEAMLTPDLEHLGKMDFDYEFLIRSDEELSNLLKKAIIQELDIYGGSMSKLFDFVQMKKYNKI